MMIRVNVNADDTQLLYSQFSWKLLYSLNLGNKYLTMYSFQPIASREEMEFMRLN